MKAIGTRQLIINVAADLFARNGVRQTTMEAIASAAGRGRRTVYMYFSDKAEIYNAVVDAEIELILKSLKEALADGGSTGDVLHRYAFERYNAVNSLLRRNPLLVRDFVQSHNRIERLREKLNADELKIITPFFEETFTSEPLIFRGTPELLAVTFLNMLRGNDRVMTARNNHEEAMERLNLACDIFIAGMMR